MLTNLEEIANYHFNNSDSGLILDTNILLLFLVGIFNKDYIKKCDFLQNSNKCYGEEHYKLVGKIIKYFNKIIITPQVLAEIYNIAHTSRIKKEKLLDEFLIKVINQLKSFKEQYINKEIIFNNSEVIKFGFADISLIEAARELKSPILTDEVMFSKTFYNIVINFSSIAANELHKIPKLGNIN